MNLFAKMSYQNVSVSENVNVSVLPIKEMTNIFPLAPYLSIFIDVTIFKIFPEKYCVKSIGDLSYKKKS